MRAIPHVRTGLAFYELLCGAAMFVTTSRAPPCVSAVLWRGAGNRNAGRNTCAHAVGGVEVDKVEVNVNGLARPPVKILTHGRGASMVRHCLYLVFPPSLGAKTLPFLAGFQGSTMVFCVDAESSDIAKR